jgi:protein O-mannosyl-transferase
MTPPMSARTHALLVVGIVVATVLTYANTFAVPFVFDDIGAVTQNPSIESFATALRPPEALSVSGRPLVNLSLAFNYALSGRAVWSYHALNLALHVACAIALFALARLTLLRTAVAADASVVAFTVALIWAVHPLHTSAVTYVMQRTELIVSLCYVFTLLGFACAVAEERGSTRALRGWLLFAVVVAALGMTAKEVMVTAPIAVLLYDATFVAHSLGAALRERGRFYAALAATWLVLAALLFGTDSRAGSAGFSAGMAWTDYAQTQLFAVAHYLRLAAWPTPLVFDYGNSIVREPLLIVSGAVVVIAVVGVIVATWRRHRPVAFGAGWFLLVLAPTSTVVPIATQTVAEHRVYLALAGPIALAVAWLCRTVGTRRVGGRALITAAAAALAVLTFTRNTAFSSVRTIWGDTAAKRPANARAHYNYGLALAAEGRDLAAREEFEHAVQLEPQHAAARHKLALAWREAGQPAAALPHFAAALAVRPTAPLEYDMAVTLLLLRRTGDAVPHLQAAIALSPRHAPSHYNLGNALAELGRYGDALAEFETAAALDPADGSARRNAQRLREYLGR